jgi:ribosome-associated protein
MTEHFQSTTSSMPLLTNANTSNTTSINGDRDSSFELAITAARAADERKGGDIMVLSVANVSYLTDYFVIVTGFSKAQVRAIARSVEDTVEETLHRLPSRTEGQAEASWVVQDYGDVIIHVLMPQEREFYNLEAFWGHAERVDFALEA